MTVREWLSQCVGVALPPEGLPELLQDGQLLLRLAILTAPDAAARIAPSTGPTGRLDAFVAASRQLGVPEPELLVPETLLHPDPHLPVSRGAVLALVSFAREAAARGLLPQLEL
jgi:hypothetical protein